MNGHLNDEQWATAVLHQSDDASAKHLAECATCREEVNSFAEAAAVARAQALKAAEQPERFWQRQREEIGARVTAHGFARAWGRWIWATATIALILLTSVLLSRNNTPPAPKAASTDPDDALLLSVQQSIRSDLPEALRPAALLTQEMVRATPLRRNP